MSSIRLATSPDGWTTARSAFGDDARLPRTAQSDVTSTTRCSCRGVRHAGATRVSVAIDPQAAEIEIDLRNNPDCLPCV